ncbi:MAG: hypothetical protein B6245_05915 [Desulfobacteraceae bacterium 4572_88]|nr:MAG: hypothetical protein B6245_05915 [Desulfobacteraceae bacterium 4572_88]
MVSIQKFPRYFVFHAKAMRHREKGCMENLWPDTQVTPGYSLSVGPRFAQSWLCRGYRHGN